MTYVRKLPLLTGKENFILYLGVCSCISDWISLRVSSEKNIHTVLSGCREICLSFPSRSNPSFCVINGAMSRKQLLPFSFPPRTWNRGKMTASELAMPTLNHFLHPFFLLLQPVFSFTRSFIKFPPQSERRLAVLSLKSRINTMPAHTAQAAYCPD